LPADRTNTLSIVMSSPVTATSTVNDSSAKGNFADTGTWNVSPWNCECAGSRATMLLLPTLNAGSGWWGITPRKALAAGALTSAHETETLLPGAVVKRLNQAAGRATVAVQVLLLPAGVQVALTAAARRPSSVEGVTVTRTSPLADAGKPSGRRSAPPATTLARE
jgi:hypothetical protein